MSSYEYIVPVTYTPLSNETYINKRFYDFKECSHLSPNDKSNLWCANRCPNDDAYCNPYVSGDKIYLQFVMTDPKVKTIIPQIINDDNDLPVDTNGAITTETGTDANNITYINYIIDTTKLLASCFYVRLTTIGCILREAQIPLFTACYNTKIGQGKSPEEAKIECYEQFCGEQNVNNFITEPYCSVRCEQTVLISGYYPTYDCNLNYYGVFTGNVPNSFIPQVRVMGEIFKSGFDITETLSNRERIKALKIDRYKLRTHKIPPYVAEILGNCFASMKLYVDGIQYKGGIKLEKIFDDGKMWIIQTDLYRDCDEINFACK